MPVISAHVQCWYIGALPSSATYIIKEVSGPLSRHLPSDVACQRIKKKDAQICDLVYSTFFLYLFLINSGDGFNRGRGR